MAVTNDQLRGTLATKDFVAEMIQGLKPLVGPAVATFSSPTKYLRLSFNSNLTITTPIEIKIHGAVADSSKLVAFEGHLNNSIPACVGRNLGVVQVTSLAQQSTQALYVVLDQAISVVYAEIFTATDTYNIISSIDDTPVPAGLIVLPVEEGDPSYFTFTVKEADGETVECPTDTTELDSIYEAGYLSDDVNITVTDSEGLLAGSGTLPGHTREASLNISVDNTNFTNKVLSIVLDTPIAPAEENKLGGILLIGSHTSDLTSSQFPVKLTTDGNHRAYVEVPLGDMDIHRYTDLALVPSPRVGLIVEYIGPTTLYLTNGYFYKYVPSSYDVLFTSDGSTESNVWTFVTSRVDTGNKVAAYNQSKEYILTTTNIVIAPKIIADLEHPGHYLYNFDIILDLVVYDTFDYETLVSTLGIRLLNPTAFDPDHGDLPENLILVLDEATGAASWVQKNVQPAISVNNPLVYKGVCYWAELEQATLTANPGEFWTIRDRVNQEYFFTGVGNTWEEKWEFMGDVFTVDGSLTVKTDVNGTQTTVTEFSADGTAENLTLVLGSNITLTPDSTNGKITIAHADTSNQASSTNTGRTYIQSIGLDEDGHVTSLSTATETVTNIKPDWNADSSADNGILNKPTIPAALVNADWNASSGVAEILNKPSIPSVGDGTLTIQRNGTTLNTFTANQSGATTVNISVPTDYISTGSGGGVVNINNYVPVGTIQMYAGDGSELPGGWLFCNGAITGAWNISNASVSKSLPGKTVLNSVIQNIYSQNPTHYYLLIYNSDPRKYVGTWHTDSLDNMVVTTTTEDCTLAYEFSLQLMLEFTLHHTIVQYDTDSWMVTADLWDIPIRLPNMETKFPLGCGNNYNLGKSDGSRKITQSNLPASLYFIKKDTSLHTMSVNDTAASLYSILENNNYYTGGDEDYDPPYLVVNFIIKY